MSDTTVEVRVPDLLTVMEAGAVARISRTTAYELAHQFLATNGEAGMPVKRVGGQLRVPRHQFEEWIGTAITSWPPVDTDTRRPHCHRCQRHPHTSVTSTKPSRRSSTTPQPQLFSV